MDPRRESGSTQAAAFHRPKEGVEGRARGWARLMAWAVPAADALVVVDDEMIVQLMLSK